MEDQPAYNRLVSQPESGITLIEPMKLTPYAYVCDNCRTYFDKGEHTILLQQGQRQLSFCHAGCLRSYLNSPAFLRS